jgi:hypothetical protein
MVRPSLAVVVVALAANPAEALAQYCIGSTAYTVVDEKGAPMSPTELRRLEVVSINGRPARRRRGADGEVYFEVARSKSGTPSYSVKPGRPLELATMAQCGEIDEVVLRWRGRLMRLHFGVAHHNTRYHIEAPPFASGTFRLTGGAVGGAVYPCAGGGGPPLIDNENRSECRVPARLWKRVSTPKARAPASGRGPTRSGP